MGKAYVLYKERMMVMVTWFVDYKHRLYFRFPWGQIVRDNDEVFSDAI